MPFFVIRTKFFQTNNVEELVSFTSDSLIKPMQIDEEIKELLKFLKKRKPKIILEIGTARGGTLFLLSRIASKNAKIISIDLPEGDFGGGYPYWKSFLYKSFAIYDQKIHLLRTDSHKDETLKKVQDILKGQLVDFLFIDGDHTYKGVKKDFEMYFSMVKEKGVIAFHDICLHPSETGCEVERFWKEIKKKYKNTEFIKDPNQGWAGIGVLYK